MCARGYALMAVLFQLLDNILPRNAGFTGVRDVVCFSLYIGLNKQEDERRRY